MSSQVKQSLFSQLSVNDNIFNTVISEISNNSGSSIPQPVMIIGQEGSGKTTLLKRIYNSNICQGKSKVWIDGRFIFCSEDIISKALHDNASIVFIDDMDFFLTRCSYEEQFRLRKFLYNENAPMMIGTISKVLPALTEYEAPFFEGLKNTYIYPVSPDIITHLFNSQDLARARLLMNFLPLTIESVKTVYNIIKLNDIPEKDTNILVSMFSNKYRNTYQSLPTNSQHILNAFESGNTAMTIPELRDKTGLPTNILTAYLKTLDSGDIIRVDKSIKRHTKYSLKDPLFQLWLTKSVQSL
ncbi:MAG: ATP-binding protein [Muribaculaceae bacterium]|nr:ATP-binding protein [Muribaculaceae bacterium]